MEASSGKFWAEWRLYDRPGGRTYTKAFKTAAERAAYKKTLREKYGDAMRDWLEWTE
jgi:hypothetical protein